MIYYTIDSLVIDQDTTADPVAYIGKHHLVLGKTLSAYLTRHNKEKETSIGVGQTTKYGKHPFFLTSKPNIDDLIYWNTVMREKYKIVMGCSGYLAVYNHLGQEFKLSDQKKYSTAQQKAFTEAQRQELMASRAEKLIKKYFK
jgi:hypothetical protein